MNKNKQYSTTRRSTLACPGELSDANFFTISNDKSEYDKRRRTLFNLYSFASHTSLRNATPELYIENCDFQHFLNNFESLINVETNAFYLTSKDMNKIDENGDFIA